MSVSYRFQEVRQTLQARVACPKCGKKRTLTLSKSYFRNGFHDERETHEKNLVKLRSEREQLERDGKICLSCEAIERGDPITKKVSPDLYDVFDRANPDVAVGQIKKQRWSPKWILVGYEDTYQYNSGPVQRYLVGRDTLYEAAEELIKRAALAKAKGEETE